MALIAEAAMALTSREVRGHGARVTHPRIWAWNPYAHVYIGAWSPYVRLLAWRQYMCTGMEPVYNFAAGISWSQYGAGVKSPRDQQGRSQFDVLRPLPTPKRVGHG